MNFPRPQTCAFYTLIILVELAIAWFLGHVLFKATRHCEEAEQWRWSSEDSRDMWIDAAKTMITASGIAAALVASLTLAAHQSNMLSALVTSSVKTATVSLVVCVCVSMFLILSLARGHEAAKARYIARRPQEGHQGEIKEGPLSNFALCITLLAAFLALSSFFVRFLFLARIVWHV
jgi:hypothetical protein